MRFANLLALCRNLQPFHKTIVICDKGLTKMQNDVYFATKGGKKQKTGFSGDKGREKQKTGFSGDKGRGNQKTDFSGDKGRGETEKG